MNVFRTARRIARLRAEGCTYAMIDAILGWDYSSRWFVRQFTKMLRNTNR